MEKAEILEKAIDKALDNGMVLHYTKLEGELRGIDIVNACSYSDHIRIIFSHDFAKAFFGEPRGKVLGYVEYIVDSQGERYSGMMNEDGVRTKYGAEALEDLKRGEKHIISSSNFLYSLMEIENEGWQHHLQQMVLQEDPIRYLESFL